MENIEKILQWNMGSWDGEPNGQVLDVLEALIEKHEPSLVALQEFPENGTARVLESAGYNVRYHTERRRKMSGFSDVWSLDETRISEHYSGILLVLEHLELSIKLNFWNVHFQAKAPERKRRSEIRNFATNYVKTSRQDPWYEVVVGDFNFEPFEESLADIDRAIQLNPTASDGYSLDQFYFFATIAAMTLGVEDRGREGLEFLKRAIFCDPEKYRDLANEEMDFYLLSVDPQYGAPFRELVPDYSL